MMKVPIILRENLVSQIYNYNSNIRLDMIDDNKYIILKENYHLHNWPDKTLLIFNGIEVLSLNIEGAEVINKLNGEHTLQEVVSNSFKELDQSDMSKYFSIKMFILQLYRRNIIDFLEYKQNRVIKNTGSRDWYVPYSCSIEITKQCDLRCKHCYGEAGAMRNTQLTEEQIYSILDKLSDGCNSVSITGGDPMCHPKIKEIIKYSIARGFETTLITNGMRLNQNWANWLSEVGIKRVKLSLDGPTKEIHDELRGVKGAFEKVILAMGYLKNAKVSFSIGTVITKKNLEYINIIADIAYENGAKSIGFGRVVNHGRAIREMKDARESDLDSIIKKVDKIMRDYKGKDFLVTYEEDGNWTSSFLDKCPSLEEYYLYRNNNVKCSCNGCGAGSRLLFIEANGNIKPCMMSTFTIGKINHGEDMVNIINKSTNECFSNLESPDLNTCKNCDYVSNCLGCISQAITNSSLVECRWKKEILKHELKMKEILSGEVGYV
ncbi:hypothetical protein Q428_13930 [Fervidicella metallireducens AeB]|uniref:Radical SAM domain protein n=2 Tax=Eubacteriales TaxID=186802 RepID=A3DG38_ACET2|nr:MULTISPECIES: radical SAM protein [Eubacteriales]ABN52917.1 Radical SAM domain protein [Acetivibrio thermocellus ATCC 27405]EYE87320.1 hypothetical protein Q428_13930 [Fervidicella metallireducens AeB]NLZ34882.1 radical SAM protein [Clostridiales bacterium]